MTVTQNQNLVTLKYVLSQLPSSQHRAGLAGLILMIWWLQEQPEFKSTVSAELKVTDLDTDIVTIQFNLAGFTALMKSHFSAGFEERENKKKRANTKQKYRTIKRQVRDLETNKTKLTTFYVYTDIVPQADLVQSFEPANSNNLVWTKLWQEATWMILRPRDKQRLPFKAMVNGTEPSEIEKIWNLLRDRPDTNVRLLSTYMLGAQAKNNEGMSISDKARFYFLLHFWSYVTQIYLPLQVNAKDEVKLHGYALAIPDVRNLAAFCQHFPSILRQRDTRELWGKPHSAIVRHAIEAGLNSLGSIHTYLSKLTPELDLSELLFGVDVFHILREQDKPQSQPQILSIQRYPPNREAIAEFTQLQDQLFDPIFGLQYWQNLIRDRARIHGFDSLLQDLPTAKTIKNDWFCRDFRTVFHPKYNAMEAEEIDETTSKNEIDSSETNQPTRTREISLESLLLRLLKTYTRHQLKHLGKEWNKEWDRQKSEILKQDKAYQDYKEKRQQIIADLHHDFRRPRETNEFLAYFAAKFTDVYQYISTEEYLLLAEQIQTQPEQIRILCLLALPVL